MSFTRKLRLKEYFHDKNIDDMSLVKNKGVFTPKRGRDAYLDCLIDILNKHPIGQNRRKKRRSNLNKSERDGPYKNSNKTGTLS